MKSVQADRNIIVTATAAVASAYIVAPLEVDETISDPYWMRVTRRATVGVNPPAVAGTWSWHRFNQREGSRVYSTDANGVLRVKDVAGTDFGYDISGDYEWGADAPNGKRGIRVRDAEFDLGPLATSLTRAEYNSIEFTFRIAPGHTGRMDIFNGHTSHTGQGGPWNARSHASIRDGRLYAAVSAGGTSTMRLDDGEWHHIVMTAEPVVGSRKPLQVYIDGKLDRTFVTEENVPGATNVSASWLSMPRSYFGRDTGYPFQGDLVDVVHRHNLLTSEQVSELYYDMFGYTPIRSSSMNAEGDMHQGARAESGMKRMLLLSWRIRTSWGDSPQHPTHDAAARRVFNHSITVHPTRQTLSEFFVSRGDDGDHETAQYLITHQLVNRRDPGDAASMHRPDLPSGPSGHAQFKDSRTGRARLIDIFEDINLDDFDVIAFQGYPNHPMNTQEDRELYEPFLDSINRALAQGHKLWVTDPYLMADLGWIERPETVPVLGVFPENKVPEVAGGFGYIGAASGNDVRSYDIAPPFNDPFGYPKPAVRPENGAMPNLRWVTDGTGRRYNMWGGDIHRNNGYRVVNEVEGLTDIPTWEVKEASYRTSADVFNDKLENEQRAYMYENREGIDYEWEYIASSGDTHELVKPSSGQGLRVGDEFYDWKWIDYGIDLYKYAGSASYGHATTATRHRAPRTWAIPPGALRIGTPLTTFRSTQHNDYGNEVENPWRNHMRNFVIRPGDVLPGYGKVKGYVYADLAEQPDTLEFGALGMPKQLTAPAGFGAFSVNSDTLENETEETFQWDYSTWGRTIYGATGSASIIGKVSGARIVNPDGKASYKWQMGVIGTLPTAQSKTSVYPRGYVPHITWNARGITWLTSVDKTDAEYSNTLGETARATGAMVTPMVSVEFERTVHVGIAEATADIVAPVEAQVRDARFFARPATARGVMLNRIITVAPEPATGFADMPQNVVRPLDIEEVLVSSTAFNNEIIYLRLEEN